MGFFIMKNVLKVVFVIIGTLIGAGFASGQEVYLFFFSYGMKGLIGILISSIIIGVVIYSTFNILNKYNSLDEKGKHTVNTVLNMEYNRCNNEICATAMVAESYDEYMPIAAHNDFADNLEEQRLMQEDLDEL